MNVYAGQERIVISGAEAAPETEAVENRAEQRESD